MLVPALGGGHYCIDSTEVTQAQYKSFLDTNPQVAAQSPECSANTTFAPSCKDFSPATTPDAPALCVDWCDASAYCTWAGKRLCGKVGGGEVDPSKLSDATQSEWFNACSKGGALAYPYGDTWVNGACVVEYGLSVLPASSVPNCVGGFPGIYNMSGNVAEWEAGCGGGDCPVRGGWSGSKSTEARCDSVVTWPPMSGGMYTGIRCCTDAGAP